MSYLKLVNNKGVQYILIATVFFSIINGLVKYLDTIPSIQIVFFRSLVSLIMSYWVIRVEKIKIFNTHTPLLLMRGLFGAIALTLYFNTIQNIPLATAVTILYAAPIFTVIFAIFILKEKPSIKQVPFFILCFIGIALLKNFDPRVSTLHFSMGICAAIFSGLAYNMIRMLKGRAHHQLIIFYFPVITIPFCMPWLIPAWRTPNFKELILLLLIGVTTQIAQVFMTKAYLHSPASKISHYNYLTCVFAFITGIIFFDEALNTLSIIGLILVFIGILFSTKFAPKS